MIDLRRTSAALVCAGVLAIAAPVFAQTSPSPTPTNTPNATPGGSLGVDSKQSGTSSPNSSPEFKNGNATPSPSASGSGSSMNGMSGMNGGKARFSGSSAYTGSPNLPLTLSMVVAGGGPGSFDTTKLLGVLAGAQTSAEVAKLTSQYGAANVTSFVNVFNFVIQDTVRLATAAGVTLPAGPNPSPADGKALASALYTAGITPDKQFNVEYMLDRLVSHPIHVQVMNDIDANTALGGSKADANYHIVLTTAMNDLKAAYKL